MCTLNFEINSMSGMFVRQRIWGHFAEFVFFLLLLLLLLLFSYEKSLDYQADGFSETKFRYLQKNVKLKLFYLKIRSFFLYFFIQK